MESKRRTLQRLHLISGALSGLLWISVLVARVTSFATVASYALIAIAVAVTSVFLLWLIGIYAEVFILKLRYIEYYVNRLAKYEFIDPNVFLQNRSRKRNTIYCNNDEIALVLIARQGDATFSEHIGEFKPLLVDKKWFQNLMGKPRHVFVDGNSEQWEYICKNGEVLVCVNNELPEHYAQFALFFRHENAIKISKTQHERLFERETSKKGRNNYAEKEADFV